MNKANQRMRIFEYCRRHGSITIREASDVLQMNSPTKRISELRDMGYEVVTEWEERTNSHGEKKRYKRYFIGEPRCNA